VLIEQVEQQKMSTSLTGMVSSFERCL